jgi:uncharacterized protein (TIGR03000 family)
MNTKTVLTGASLLVALFLAAPAPAAAQFRVGPPPAPPVSPANVPAPRFNSPPVNAYPPKSGATFIPFVGYYLPNRSRRSRIPNYIPPWSAETETAPERKFVPQPDDSAWITVRVPADAELWFDGVKVAATGAIRKLRTPVLKQGSLYTYQVRARWGPAGNAVTQTQPVVVTAGSDVSLDLTPPAGKAP